MVKLPSKSAVVPLAVPLTTTDAPNKGPLSSETLPDTVCAFAKPKHIMAPTNKKLLSSLIFINS